MKLNIRWTGERDIRKTDIYQEKYQAFSIANELPYYPTEFIYKLKLHILHSEFLGQTSKNKVMNGSINKVPRFEIKSMFQVHQLSDVETNILKKYYSQRIKIERLNIVKNVVLEKYIMTDLITGKTYKSVNCKYLKKRAKKIIEQENI